jgi:hypothetical protein
MVIGFSPSSSRISYTSAGDRSFAIAARNCWSSSILRSCAGVRARDWLCARASIRLESTFRIVTKLHSLRSFIPQATLCNLPCGAGVR